MGAGVNQRSPGAPATHFFGLFDGHAGGRCSKHISSTLPTFVAEDNLFATNLPMALKRSYHTANNDFLKIAEQQRLHDGSTGLCTIIRNGKLLVGNVGDCRCLLLSSGKAIQMSVDQKPTNPDEIKRIISLGGSITNNLGVARVNGVLAVSRAFGNRKLRKVIRPDIEMIQRDLTREDHFLVIASDGLWDVLRNKDVCDICYTLSQSHRPQQLAEELVHTAIARGSMDNVTCIVIKLAGYIAKWNADQKSEFNLEKLDSGPSNNWNLRKVPQSFITRHELASQSFGQSHRMQTSMPLEDFTPETWDDSSPESNRTQSLNEECDHLDSKDDSEEGGASKLNLTTAAAQYGTESDEGNYVKTFSRSTKFSRAESERASTNRYDRSWQSALQVPDGPRNHSTMQAHAPTANGQAHGRESPTMLSPPSHYIPDNRQRLSERYAVHRIHSRNQETRSEEENCYAFPSADDGSHMKAAYGTLDGSNFTAQHCVIQSAADYTRNIHLPAEQWAATCVLKAPYSSNEIDAPIRGDRGGDGDGSRESKDCNRTTAAFDIDKLSVLSNASQQCEADALRTTTAADMTRRQQRPRKSF